MAGVTTSVAEVLASVATQAGQRFTGHNGRVRGSAVVHRIHAERWLADIEVPAPAGRVGVAGWDLLGALVPSTDPVTCARCLRSGEANASGVEQLPLWQ